MIVERPGWSVTIPFVLLQISTQITPNLGARNTFHKNCGTLEFRKEDKMPSVLLL